MHIGERIKNILITREITVVEFANKLHCTRENAHRILLKKDIDTGLLRRISHILGHDFFKEISECEQIGHM